MKIYTLFSARARRVPLPPLPAGLGGPPVSPAGAGRGRAGAEPRQKLEKYQRATVEKIC